MAVTTTKTNKPINPRGNDQSPKGYNRAALYSGKALDFDGVNDQITFGTISDLTFGTGDFSVVLDWQIDSVSTYSWAIAKNPATDLGIGINNTGGLLRLWIGGTLSLGTENILGSDWKKIAVVRESGVVSAYINGVAIPLTETAMAGSIDSGDLIVGSWVSNADFWNGLLNNIRIFNTALTAAQVSDLYNNPEKIVPTGVEDTALKLWLPMQEGAGTTAYDGSGNGNHGTINGATYVNGVGSPVAQSAVIDWNKGTNEVQYSEQLDNAYWSLSRISAFGSGSVANSATAPDGTQTAEYLQQASAQTTSGGAFRSAILLSSGNYTVSVFAKKGEQRYLRLGGSFAVSGTPLWCNFDLEDGIIGTPDTGLSAEIDEFSNGWYRCSISANKPNTTGQNIFFYQSNSLNGSNATPLDGLYLWGASLTKTSDVKPYIPTLSSAQTSDVLLPQGLTTGRDITGVNLFENVRKQGALNLDGNSWAEVHDNASLDYSSEVTLEAWIRWAGEADQSILGKWHGPDSARSLILYAYDNDQVSAFYSSNGSTTAGSIVASQTLTTGNWYHCVFTSDGSTIKIYVNAVEGNSASYSGGFYVSTKNLEIGTYQTDEDKAYNGPIAQPRIYNRALTAEEVERNYNAGKNIYTNS